MDEPLKRRRQLLQAAGAGGVSLLAGCSGLLGSNDESGDESDELADVDGDKATDSAETTESAEDSGGDDQSNVAQQGDGREVGMISQPDRDAIAKIRQQIRAGELTRQEGAERRQELIKESVNSLVDKVEKETELEITKEYTEMGAVRASGAPTELIDMLSYDQTSGLVSADRLDQGQQPPSGE